MRRCVHAISSTASRGEFFPTIVGERFSASPSGPSSSNCFSRSRCLLSSPAYPGGRVEQHHAAHALGVRRRIRTCHQAAERVAHDHHVLEKQAIEEGMQRIGIVSSLRLLVFQEIGVAVPGSVPGDEAVALQRLELVQPGSGLRADPVQEDERPPGTRLPV
jgi:hypothetical protein